MLSSFRSTNQYTTKEQIQNRNDSNSPYKGLMLSESKVAQQIIFPSEGFGHGNLSNYKWNNLNSNSQIRQKSLDLMQLGHNMHMKEEQQFKCQICS